MDNMLDSFEPIPVLSESDRIVDIIDKSRTFLINDYYLSMNYNKKIEISCIGDLKTYLENLVNSSVRSLNYVHSKSTSYCTEQDVSVNKFGYFTISGVEKEMIITQLVIDILFDKFLDEQREPLICRSEYSDYMAQMYTELLYQYDENNIQTILPGSVRNKIEKKMVNYSDMIKNSELKNEVSELGIDPEKYIEYNKPPEKNSPTQERPKHIWDFFFYNSYMLSGIQYNRNRLKPTNKSSNYTYDKKTSDIKLFHKFSGAILAPNRILYKKREKKEERNKIEIFTNQDFEHKETAEDFFIKMMEYYFLESYKRIDFMLKYANYLKDTSELEIDNKYLAILTRFHPVVICPQIDSDNKVAYDYKHNYYRPMLFAENRLLNSIFAVQPPDADFAVLQLRKLQIIRARVYELFKFYAHFKSSDYEDIKQFIEKSYNLRNYHESVNVNQYLEFTSKSSTAKAKKIIRIFIKLNNVLFPDSPKRRYKLKKEIK